MNGAILLLPLYAFILRAETTLRLNRVIINVESTKPGPAV
jgi:hypothetical protein